MKLLASASVVLLLGLPAAGTATAATAATATVDSGSPQALYQALLTTPVGKLPPGYHVARRGVYELSSQALKHNAVGGVEIDIDGDAAIIYLVHATRADAVSDWRQSHIARGTGSSSAPGRFPWPATIYTFSIAGKDGSGNTVTRKVTALAFTSHNVIVEAMTATRIGVHQTDLKVLGTLGDFALDHLKTLKR